MTHTGPNYGWLGGAHLADEDCIEESSSSDNLRNRDGSWNHGRGLYVKWTDGYNQDHRVVIQKPDDEVTVMFPCSGKEIYWCSGTDKQRVRTGFDAVCNWVEAKFSYVDSGWGTNHGIKGQVKGYSNIESRDVDWERVRKMLDSENTIAQIAQALK